jgi:hypothetical protein
MLTVRGQLNSNGDFDWRNSIIDATIMAFLTFFSTLGGTTAAGISAVQAIISAAIAGCTQFFAILAIKRGLIKEGSK